MPLAHENIVPRTNGGQESADPREVVLPKDAPWVAAEKFLTDRYTQGDTRLLHYHRGAFYSWTGTHYREVVPEALQRELYQFFAPVLVRNKKGEIEPFNPNPGKVSAVEHALKRLTLIDAKVNTPCWLGQDHAPAKDVIVVQNGILICERGPSRNIPRCCSQQPACPATTRRPRNVRCLTDSWTGCGGRTGRHVMPFRRFSATSLRQIPRSRKFSSSLAQKGLAREPSCTCCVSSLEPTTLRSSNSRLWQESSGDGH